ncbi:hypothetical protein BIZ37_27605 [Photobacterium sp. BZF1]|uniref:hypothetical protein n=1 Tax=Photobacterium sp. BZF1 TaxID=1904457 RepID=UPI001653D96E|nr:hypothetical protein [Photobacterium sp. BZF1]MBC7006328.1 hypothetical protein [Photobacterium sp. BZF1]
MNNFLIITKGPETRAIDGDNADTVLYWVEKGWSQDKYVAAMSEGHAVDAYLRGKDAAEPTMAHGYQSTNGKLADVKVHLFGYALLIAGLFFAFIGISEIGSYSVNWEVVYNCFTAAGLAEIVAIILVIVGQVNAKTVKAHNLLIDQLNK